MPNRSLNRFILLLLVTCLSHVFATAMSLAADELKITDTKPADTKPDTKAVEAKPDKRLLIISVDGLRPDLALRADAPNIHALMKSGSYSLWAQTLPIGKTLPSHTAMLTGVSMEKHGIYWNEDWLHFRSQIQHPNWPTIFELAKKKGYTTALAAGKYKFSVLAREGSIDWLSLPDQPKTVIGPAGIRIAVTQKVDANGLSEYDRKFSDQWVGEQAAAIIDEHKPQVMFVHFPRVDTAGHSKGWGSPQQMAAIALADKALGVVLDALRDAKIFDDTLIILSADHGGMGTVHHGKDPRGLHIPWIIRGPGIRKNYDLNQIEKLTITTMDTFGTAAKHLGISFKVEDEIEGRSVKEAYEPPKEEPKKDDAKKDEEKKDEPKKEEAK